MNRELAHIIRDSIIYNNNTKVVGLSAILKKKSFTSVFNILNAFYIGFNHINIKCNIIILTDKGSEWQWTVPVSDTYCSTIVLSRGISHLKYVMNIWYIIIICGCKYENNWHFYFVLIANVVWLSWLETEWLKLQLDPVRFGGLT